MDKRIAKLKRFIDKYGEDFLEDGTKTRIVNSLENGNKSLALEILNSMNDEWLIRTKELGRFLIFTDTTYRLPKGKQSNEPFYKANYIDSLELQTEHIPTLRRIILREKDKNPLFKGWEI